MLMFNLSFLKQLGSVKRWVIVQSFQDTDDMLVRQFSVLCDKPYNALFSFHTSSSRNAAPFARFWWLCRQVSVNHLRAGMLCIRQSQL